MLIAIAFQRKIKKQTDRRKRNQGLNKKHKKDKKDKNRICKFSNKENTLKM